MVISLTRYEDQNVDYYSDSDLTQRILTHPAIGDMKEKIDDSHSRWRNSYKNAYNWLKVELLDIKGIYEALAGRENVIRFQSSTDNKKRQDQAELEKLSMGKKTLKTLFKSKSSKDTDILNLQAAIEVANRDVADYKKLINFLTVYHGQVAIPKFKKEKVRQYLKMLNSFCVKEISNSHVSATLWHSVLEINSSNK